MKNESHYQWCFEELDESGDIIDPEFDDALHSKVPLGESMRLALVWMYGNNVDGEIDREYAYVDPISMTLPGEFENGRKVPAKYRAELAMWAAQ